MKYLVCWEEIFEAEVEANTEYDAKNLVLDGLIIGKKVDEEIIDIYEVE